MALPKRRKSRARVRTRQQQWRAAKLTMTTCPHCSETILPHRACGNCGYYNGRQVLPPRIKTTPRPDAD
ncbi:MAG: 50S ribosomal protein L32 [Abitibacteriaceae bacterium]|nr:50S ribosomal protein L32 [Abditibacteriaceae bacterium]MBV9864816.1 50S ribosomal protein L32 [Abditibacteriaceae bacterium]